MLSAQKIPTTFYGFLWYFIRLQPGSFLLMMITSLGWSIQEAFYPYFFKLIIDKITENASQKNMIFTILMPTLSIGIAVWLLVEIGFRAYDFLSAKVYPRFQADIRKSVFQYASEHSYQYFSDNFSGSIANKISRLSDAASNFLSTVITILIPVLIAFMISIMLLYQVKPLFAYTMAGWLFIHLSIAVFFTKRCAVYSSIHSATVTTLNGKIVDTLSNISNVRLFARNRFEMGYIKKYQDDALKTAYKLFNYNAVMKLSLSIASQSFFFMMIGMGIYAWQKDALTLGDLTLVLTSLKLIGLAWYMGMHLIKIYEDKGTCQEGLSIVQKSHHITDKPHAKRLNITRGEIVFENVTFHYNRKRPIFKNKTVTIHSGEKVGLVGFSGSGKTTFVNLILRYFDLENGRILIDNQDISLVTQDSVRENIALIPQDATLFHRTLMENIRYGRLDASDSEVVQAAKEAHCHEFIEQLSEGYHSLVGERGVKLSGGQRQRIAIARAILKNASVLILDEATSSLDSITENYIQNSLQKLMHKRTTIVIAHRLSTLSGMDRILVFQNGHIIEDGSHTQLSKKKSHYADLWNMQADGFLPENPEGSEIILRE